MNNLKFYRIIVNKIVKEMQNKGITLHVDESETHQGPNFICGWC